MRAVCNIVALLGILGATCSAQSTYDRCSDFLTSDVLIIVDVNSTGFSIAYSSVAQAVSYQYIVRAQHDRADQENYVVQDNPFWVGDRRSNINYLVSVRPLNANNEAGYISTICVRTAPSGSSILQVITAPTFLTVFLEETPGSTAWQIEYTNTVNGSVSTLDVPDGTQFDTSYVAIIDLLHPNTRYSVRARVSQIFSSRSYTEEQSPFGERRDVTTDKVSAFGRVELATRVYTDAVNADESLRSEIAAELQSAYQVVSNDIFNVSITELENATSGNILCHHEIYLNVRTSQPDVSDLVLNNDTTHADAVVRFEVGKNPLYGFCSFFGSATTYILQYVPGKDSVCPSRFVQFDRRKWTLFSKDKQFEDYETARASPTSSFTVTFMDTEIESKSGMKLFDLELNTIYGVKQNYLLKTCDPMNATKAIYSRFYGSFNEVTELESDKYTILRLTGFATEGTRQNLFNATAIYNNGTRDGFAVPSAMLGRSTSLEFSSGSFVVHLRKEDLDNSVQYLVKAEGLPESEESQILGKTELRNHFSTLVPEQFTFTLPASPCLSSRHDCHANATCNVDDDGNYACQCEEAFDGDGRSCVANCTQQGNCPQSGTPSPIASSRPELAWLAVPAAAIGVAAAGGAVFWFKQSFALQAAQKAGSYHVNPSQV